MNFESFDAGKEKQDDGLDGLREENVSVTRDAPGIEDFVPEPKEEEVLDPEEEAWRELDKKHGQ